MKKAHCVRKKVMHRHWRWSITGAQLSAVRHSFPGCEAIRQTDPEQAIRQRPKLRTCPWTASVGVADYLPRWGC